MQYETELSALDAKEFGVPQTRQRKYMLIWQRDLFEEGTDVAGLWSNLVNYLRCPLKFSVDSFLLRLGLGLALALALTLTLTLALTLTLTLTPSCSATRTTASTTSATRCAARSAGSCRSPGRVATGA